MLEKKNRIRLNKEFDQVFKTGQSFYGKAFGVKVAKSTGQEIRLGVLVGTKISKKAVIRNKLKRQIREIIRQELSLLKEAQDLVVISLPSALELDFELLKADLQTIFRKLKLYK
jgi:ribonuclease P protein component